MKSKYVNTFLLLVVLTVACAIPGMAQTSAEQPQATLQTLQTVKLKVSGITCSADCKDIQKAVSTINGVRSCKQAGKPTATSVFEVTFDPAVVTEKEIYKVVEDTPGCGDAEDRPYKAKKG